LAVYIAKVYNSWFLASNNLKLA